MRGLENFNFTDLAQKYGMLHEFACYHDMIRFSPVVFLKSALTYVYFSMQEVKTLFNQILTFVGIYIYHMHVP